MTSCPDCLEEEAKIVISLLAGAVALHWWGRRIGRSKGQKDLLVGLNRAMHIQKQLIKENQ